MRNIIRGKETKGIRQHKEIQGERETKRNLFMIITQEE